MVTSGLVWFHIFSLAENEVVDFGRHNWSVKSGDIGPTMAKLWSYLDLVIFEISESGANFQQNYSNFLGHLLIIGESIRTFLFFYN